MNRKTTTKWIMFSAIFWALCLASPGWSQTPPRYFGMNTGQMLDSESWPSVPLGSIRLWDTHTTWNDLEPSKGAYNWSLLDGYLALAQAHNVDVLYTFGNTAQWAASATGQQCIRNSGGCYPPASIQDWDQFVTALVAHSAGRIKYWELWNEANAPEYWSGNSRELVELAKHAYTIIKTAYPAAVVLCPSSNGSAAIVEEFLNAYFAAGGATPADAVAFHGYVGSIPEGILYLETHVRAAMSSHGIATKPIYDTEGGWGMNSALPSMSDRPGYLAREFLLQWSSGVSGVYWYAWNNPAWGTLWTSSGIQPAGIAYGQVHGWIDGATLNSPCAMASDSTWTCSFKRSDGSSALAIWNAATTKNYTPASEYKFYLDLAGHTNFVKGTVSIGYTPILLVVTPIVAPTRLTAVVQ